MHIDSEQSMRFRVPKGGFGFLNFPQNRDTTLVVRVPVQRRAHATRGSLQQPDPEPGLQLLVYRGGGRSSNLEILSGDGEAPRVNDAVEHPHTIKRLHNKPYVPSLLKLFVIIQGILISVHI